MWMQKSVEGGAGAMNFHDRNRFAQSSPYASQGYGGGGVGAAVGTGDWKSKILESGQWLGGKVIEYGGKLARGASHDSIPEHMRGVPHNDGRASWMADIRNSSFTNTDYQGGGGGLGSSTYQNDFATERPKAYSDYSSGGYKPSTASSYDARPPSLSQDRYSGHHHHHDKSSRRVKKKSESSKKNKKKGRSSRKHRDASSDSSEASESESESTTSSEKESLSDASLSSDSESTRRKSKSSKKHAKKKDSKKKKKSNNAFYSDDDEEEDSDDNQTVSKSKSKKADNYSYSFDPSKLPSPPAEDSKKSSKESKASRSKKGSKSRGRRQSVESSDSDIQQDNQKSKHSKRSTKKGKEKAAVDESVDLLGVDFAPQPVASNADGQALAQPQAANTNLLTSVFDAQPSADPLQDLAGLSFDAPAPTAQTSSTESKMMFGAPQQQQQEQQEEFRQQDPAGARFLKTLLPENDIVDLNTLASAKKPEKSASAAEKKTLNDLQKAKAGEQPVPVMPVNPHAAQQQQMMYQMSQMQLGHPAAMQMQMQPLQMQMQMPSQQQQQLMMMNAQMMQQQQQQQQLLMQQQQQMMGAQNQSQNAGASTQGGAMFSSFQQ